jgi:eukaryotic-like serine/threonine-protein kinase
MIGKTVSHYRILERFGGDGMSVVYKAEDTQLQRTLALKFLPATFSTDPGAKGRFTRVDETPDGQLLICIAHYEGKTLKKNIERGGLPLHDVPDITLQTPVDCRQPVRPGLFTGT